MSSAPPTSSTSTKSSASPQPPSHPPTPRPLAALSSPHNPHPYPPHSVSFRPPPQSQNQQMPTKHNQLPHSLLYPAVSTGRDLVPKPLRPDQTVTIANPNLYSARSHIAHPRPPMPPTASAHLDALNPVHFVNPPYSQQPLPHVSGVVPGAIQGIPIPLHPKGGPSTSSVPERNAYKNPRDRNRDETLITLRNRKVTITNGTSLYALCRSWLRNGVPEEIQPQFGSMVKSLPRPLPRPATDNLPKKKEDGREKEEEEESIEHLSTKDLLKKHVRRAKRVRARLMEERLQRIERYKTRLALLLPPLVEQFQNDGANGN